MVLSLALWQIKLAFECPVEEGPAMACSVWVAAEWIIQSGEIIHEEMNSHQALDEDTAKLFEVGPLCEEKSPLSLDRWKFWMARLLEFSSGSYKIGPDTGNRITLALRKMENITSKCVT